MCNPNDNWDNKRELQQTLLKAYDRGLYDAESTKAVKRELAIELALRNRKDSLPTTVMATTAEAAHMDRLKRSFTAVIQTAIILLFGMVYLIYKLK